MSEQKRNFAREFADTARLLIGGNGDFKSFARDLAKLVEDYDGLAMPVFSVLTNNHPERGEYNKLVRIANILSDEDYKKFSSQDDPNEVKSWNNEE